MRGPLALAVVLLGLGAPAMAGAGTTNTAAEPGPTEDDIRSAYGAKIDWLNAASRKFLDAKAADQIRIKVVKLTLVECGPIAEHPRDHLCSVLVESGLGDAATETRRVELVMIRDGAGWKVQ